jgi:hypothetical protein
MRGVAIAAIVAITALSSWPAQAEPRWLGCKYSERGKDQTFALVFDDLRNVAFLLDAGLLVEGSNTSITFQALRTRFPNFTLTYNRNDGALSVTPPSGGLVTGECRRIAPPPGAPNPP